MRQKTGPSVAFIGSEGQRHHISVPKPKPFYVLPKTAERLTEQFYNRHSLPCQEADQLVSARQKKLLADIEAKVKAKRQTRAGTSQTVPPEEQEIWNRAPLPESAKPNGSASLKAVPPIPRKRGPKADTENHAKVAEIISRYGGDWTADERLAEICETRPLGVLCTQELADAQPAVAQLVRRPARRTRFSHQDHQRPTQRRWERRFRSSGR